MSIRVLIASPLEQEYVAAIRAAHPGVDVLYEPELLPQPRYVADHTGVAPSLSAEQLARWRDLLARADVSFDFDWWRPSEMAVNCPNLRWVQATSAGIGEFLRHTGLVNTDIAVTTAAGIHAVPLAEFALCGVLHFVKGLPDLRRRQAEHRWERYTTRCLSGRRLVVVGLGGIGRQVVSVFAGLGVDVVGVGREGVAYDIPGLTEVYSNVGAAVRGADALVLACPLTDRTRGLIGAAELRALAPGAVVVNVARGPVIDEAALIEALRDGHLGGACLDVVDTEPLPASSPLWDLANVIISPHSAATVDTENALLTELFIDNLRRRLDGRPLRNVFSRERGY